MFKTIVACCCLLISATHGGYLETPLAYHAPVAIKTAPAIPIATSYQNTFQISAAPVPVVVKAAPLVAHYAAAPAIIKSPLLADPYYH